MKIADPAEKGLFSTLLREFWDWYCMQSVMIAAVLLRIDDDDDETYEYGTTILKQVCRFLRATCKCLYALFICALFVALLWWMSGLVSDYTTEWYSGWHSHPDAELNLSVINQTLALALLWGMALLAASIQLCFIVGMAWDTLKPSTRF